MSILQRATSRPRLFFFSFIFFVSPFTSHERRRLDVWKIFARGKRSTNIRGERPKKKIAARNATAGPIFLDIGKIYTHWFISAIPRKYWQLHVHSRAPSLQLFFFSLRTVLAYDSNLDGSNAGRRATNQLTRIKKTPSRCAESTVALR